MEVILLQKVANLGTIGDRVKVKSGYGRNYLLPHGKATLATPANIAKFETRRVELERVAREEFGDAELRAKAFADFKLEIRAKAVCSSCGRIVEGCCEGAASACASPPDAVRTSGDGGTGTWT